MSRLALVAQEGEPAELKPVFDQLRATRGRVPGMYRVLAHQPAVLAAHRAYFHAALDAGVLPRAMKEKIAYRAARACGSDYSSASHHRYAVQHGVSTDVLAAIDREDYSALPAREQAALAFTVAMVRGRGRVDDPVFEDLQRHFRPDEMVEIIALIGIMELASTFGAVFGLEAD